MNKIDKIKIHVHYYREFFSEYSSGKNKQKTKSQQFYKIKSDFFLIIPIVKESVKHKIVVNF